MKVTNLWQELTIFKNGIENPVLIPVSIQIYGTEKVLYCRSNAKPTETAEDGSKYNYIEYYNNSEKPILSPDGSKIWVRTIGANVDLVCFDGVSSPEGAVSQSYVEQNVKLGKQWELSARFTDIVALTGIAAFKLTTGSKPVLLKGSEISTEAQAFVRRIYKGSMATDGAVIPIYNLNDDLNPLTPLTVANIVTGVTGGTECFSPFYRKNSSGGTSGPSTVRTGSGLVAGLDKILKPNTTYYFTFQNLGTEVAEITFYSTFYEGDYYA